MWAAQLLDWRRPRSHLTSGGSGTMGFAVPAALGAAVACPDETIWVIVGDGGFQMTNQEIATMAQEGLTNVKIAIMNNGYLGMVRQWQQLFEGKRYSGTPLSGPDFAKLAEAYGVKRRDRGDVRGSAERRSTRRGTRRAIVVIDFRVEREANVFPIVPQGQSIGDMLVDPTTKAEHHEPAAGGGDAAMTEITPLAAPIVRVQARAAQAYHSSAAARSARRAVPRGRADPPARLQRGEPRRRRERAAGHEPDGARRRSGGRAPGAAAAHAARGRRLSVAEIGRGDALVRETALAVVEVGGRRPPTSSE